MKYFTIEELTRSAAADRLGIDNTPAGEIARNLMTLTEQLLDPLREMWGAPLRVTSGYRCPSLNRAVGGVRNSHHLRGMAADIVTASATAVDNRLLMKMLTESWLRWTQAIMERNRHGATWVHVAYDATDLRNEVIYI